MGATALLAVPMSSERGVLGAVVLARRGGGPFSREDQDILSVLVYQLSAALVSAQLYKALKESQAQVVQSSKMAAVGQLAGGVAHELNTPLGAIALAIDGALSTLHNKPDRAESRLQRAATSVQQMKEIVSKLLFYSRDARSGRRETDLNKVIEDTLQLIGHQLRLDNVQVETQLGELPTLVANQNELQQIFTNLCLNARDAVLATEATQRKIHIATSVEGDHLKATVRDWGSGMTAAVKERIFDPFFTTKDVGKGTGLGLSVTLQLVQQHNGKISLETHPGKGTQFTLLLPLQPPSEDQ
jgi:signal transduction histidine kinase